MSTTFSRQSLMPMDEATSGRFARVQFALAESGVGSTSGLWLVLSTLFRHAPDRLGHAQRVARMARAIASHLGQDTASADQIERAALAHEIGAVIVPDLPGGRATEDLELRAKLAEQAVVGASVLATSPFLAAAARLVRATPEWIDGTGRPMGLLGDQIPFGARILGVADVFDVMETTCQQLGWPRDLAAVELVRYAGRRFDADVVAAALRVVEAVPTARSAGMVDARQVV